MAPAEILERCGFFRRPSFRARFNFGATLEILMKDVDLAVEQGEALGVPIWVCPAAHLC